MTVEDRRNPYREFDSTLIDSFLNGRELNTVERMSTGKSNTNFKLSLDDGQTVVLRLYSEQGVSSPQREARIANIIGDRVPVPAILDAGDNWALFQFAPGKTLDTAPEHAGAAAEVLAHLSEHKFDTGGWIQPDGTITPFDFGDGGDGDDSGDQYVMSMLEKPEVQRWLGPGRARSLTEILKSESSRLAELGNQKILVHGDFNPTNILVDGGKITAVVDWEFAHVGTPYMDIGNLLRNIEPRFHEAVRGGLASGGFDVPDDWKKRAALIDISSHIEFLTSSRPDQFKRSRIELIDSFIGMFGQ